MKRVRVSAGKFVNVPTALVDKAERVFTSSAFTVTQVRNMAATEPMAASDVMFGKVKQTGRRVTPDAGVLPRQSGTVVHSRDGRIIDKTAKRANPVKHKAA